MGFDLGDALRRKGEFESARSDDFEFRVRARTMRLIAERLGLAPGGLISAIALHDDEAIVARHTGAAEIYPECVAEARRQLITERGDPAPHRLA